MAEPHDDLRSLVVAQSRIIEELQARVADLEALAVREGPGVSDAGRGPAANVEAATEAVTDRRQLLSRAAGMAAGAVAGGAALAVTQASPAAAASGTFDGNPAVSATANPTNNTAVDALSNNGTAVRGTDPAGRAIQGITTLGTAVDALATTGTAVKAYAGNGDAINTASFAGTAMKATIDTNATHLELLTNTTVVAPPSSIISRTAGSMVRDSNGDLWLCVGSGTPGLWRRVSGTNTAGALTLLASPVRIYDSRPGNAPATLPKTPLANGSVRTLDCTNNSSGVPIGAQAVLANVTVVNTSANGFLVAYRNGIGVPATSTINWFQAGTIAANTTVIACDTLARIACYVPATSSADFFIDVLGYFR